MEEKKQESINLRETIELLEESLKLQEAENLHDTLDPNYQQARIRTLNAELTRLRRENQNLAKDSARLRKDLEKVTSKGNSLAYQKQLQLEARARLAMEKQELEVALETGNDQNPEIVALKAKVKALMAAKTN